MEAFNNMLGFTPIPHPQISDKIYDGFLLPIEYLDKSQTCVLSKTVSDDLELFSGTEDSSSNNPSMYTHLCSPTHDFGRILIPEMAKTYTTNVGFLEDTQQVVHRMSVFDLDRTIESNKKTNRTLTQDMTTRFREVWKEIKEDTDFLDKHSFMEYVFLENLNHSRPFLNVYSVINILSPVYSLAMPLVILLMPFVLLKLWRVPISFDVYLKTLRDVSKTHFIGRLINIKEWNFENAMYALFIGGMYILQTYNQVVYVFKYHTSIKRMNSNLLFLRDYLDCTIGSMDSFVRLTAGLSYYGDFCQDVHSHKLVLQELRDLIGDSLTPYGWTLKKVGELGHMFHCYYQLYSSMDYEASLKYSVGFEGYIDLLRGVERGVKARFLGKAAFSAPLSEEEKQEQDSTEKQEQLIFEGQYYPAHKNTAYIQNTVDLSANLIITGVNASGKTTTLKTTALNIIFSQQVGYGFYNSATLVPFKHIHSYLNIPDTSGRDSLFQAESRRCKEILDKIKDAPITESHFVIFDELYSGTNPKEAAKSAHSLLKYLAKKDNVRFILTTHYVEVCKKFKKSEKVKNYKMIVERTEEGGFEYTYKMRRGISTMEGGIAILKTMDYPQEILNDLTVDLQTKP